MCNVQCVYIMCIAGVTGRIAARSSQRVISFLAHFSSFAAFFFLVFFAFFALSLYCVSSSGVSMV